MTALLEAQHVSKVFGRGLIKKHRVLALEDFSLAITGGQPMIVGRPAVISARTTYFVPLDDTHVAGPWRFKQS